MNFRKIAFAALVSASALAALTPSASAFHGGHGGGFGHGGFGHGGFHGGGFHHHGWGHGGWGYAGYYGGCYPRRFINAFGEVVVTTRCY